jgi:hypothetical protein
MSPPPLNQHQIVSWCTGGLQANSLRQAPEIVQTISRLAPSGIQVPQRPAKQQRLAPPEFNRADHGGLDPTHIQTWDVELHQWRNQTSQLVSDMVGCAWCGRIAMGGKHSPQRAHMRLQTSVATPPAAAANPIMAVYMVADQSTASNSQRHLSPTGMYWACQACQCSNSRRAAQQDLHTARYVYKQGMK